MSTNPNNAIGTNGAYGGRTSVDAFNDDLGVYQGRGIVSGFAVSPNTGMTVVVGGSGVARDVAVAEDNIGNRTTVNNISNSPVTVTIPGAPASNSRIDSIVAYVENPAQGTSTIVDNYEACGLIVVSGNVASTPTDPNDSAIRTAITADGAGGSNAYYVVLGNVTVSSGTTDITSNMIAQGANVNLRTAAIGNNSIGNSKIVDNAVTSAKIANGAVGTTQIANTAVTLGKISTDLTTYSTTEKRIGTWIDGKPIYRKVISGGTPTQGNMTIQHGISNFYAVLSARGFVLGNKFGVQPIPRGLLETQYQGNYGIFIGDFSSTTFLVQFGSYDGEIGTSFYIVLDYIKTS